MTDPPKDPNEAMNAILRSVLESGRDVVVSVEAAKLVARLREDNPDLLRDWLWYNAEQFVSDALGSRNRSRRAHVRRTCAAVSFSQAANSADPVAELAPFRVRHVIDINHTQREVGRMTGEDHLFVAQAYELEAVTSQMLAAFHRAVARRVGDRTTREVMDEATYLRLYNSITRNGE